MATTREKALAYKAKFPPKRDYADAVVAAAKLDEEAKSREPEEADGARPGM